MTTPTPEQRAQWREDSGYGVLSDSEANDRILALLDALDAAEAKMFRVGEALVNEQIQHLAERDRAEAAEAALARVEAALDENGYNPYPNEILADIRAALDGEDQ